MLGSYPASTAARDVEIQMLDAIRLALGLLADLDDPTRGLATFDALPAVAAVFYKRAGDAETSTMSPIEDVPITTGAGESFVDLTRRFDFALAKIVAGESLGVSPVSLAGLTLVKRPGGAYAGLDVDMGALAMPSVVSRVTLVYADTFEAVAEDAFGAAIQLATMVPAAFFTELMAPFLPEMAPSSTREVSHG